MDKPCILVADDDVSVRRFISANLDARNYEVLLATDGFEAMKIYVENRLDLIILDISMPVMDGFTVCRLIREKSRVPIIMLSVEDGERDKRHCLELGADDYMTKPFSLNELLTRIRAIIRRSAAINYSTFSPTFIAGDLEVDYDNETVYIKGQEVKLTNTEYKILALLTINAGRIISSQLIIEKVWGQEYIAKSRILWVNLSRLRRKLKERDANHNYISTKSGLGYMIKEKVTAPAR